jgi:hypothetical protein
MAGDVDGTETSIILEKGDPRLRVSNHVPEDRFLFPASSLLALSDPSLVIAKGGDSSPCESFR